MKIYGYIFLLMLLAIHACMEAQTYTGPQFYKLPSFDAMLLAKERIAHGASTPRTALTGVDYKNKIRASRRNCNCYNAAFNFHGGTNMRDL